MATILRPPLAFPPQRKLPIAAVDYFSRPLTLGINPNAAVGQLHDSATPRKRQVRVELYPNLLTTTLAPVQVTLPPGEQWFDSAPSRRSIVSAQQLLQGFIVDAGPEAAVLQLSASAPARRKALSIEQYTNLLTTTLTVTTPLALPLLAEQLSDSAPPRKRQVRFDLYPNLQESTLPNAARTLPQLAVQWDWSAPPRPKARAQVEQPPRRLQIDPVPQVQRLDQSATPRKRQVRFEDYPNPVVLAPVFIPKPLGYPVDLSEFQPKYEIQLDTYPNTVLLGIVEPEEASPTPRRRSIVVRKVERSAIAAHVDRSTLVHRKPRR